MKNLPLIPTLMVLFFVILMTSMGFWQIRRAAEKEHLLELLADDNIIEITQKTQIKNLPRYANVKLKGHFVDAPQLLLDNQVDEGVQGYHAFTPFIVDELNLIIMVNRGWLVKNKFTDEQLGVDSKPISLIGKLNTPPQVGIQLGEIELIQQRAIQVITYYEEDKVKNFVQERLCKSLDCVVSDKVLLMDKFQDNGFKREWKPVIMQPSKHIAYAVQWFAMTLVLIVIFIYWLRKQVN
jgi:surfeit locus 1 family protein